jgi:mannose-6-phosphate isomerase-like protein (cupin superfamily)
MEDIVVVNTQDVVYIGKRWKTQDIKKLVEKLKDTKWIIQTPTGFRPWGAYYILAEWEGYKIKKIIVKPGKKLSLQRHKYRSEHWVVIKGKGKVLYWPDRENLKLVEFWENQSMYIPKWRLHRLINDSDKDLEIIEIQVGDYLGEDDIERIEDDWGR